MKHSIFIKSLAFVICFIMFAGVMTSCLPDVEFNPPEFTIGSADANNTTTGDVVDKPVEDDPVIEDPNQLFSASAELETGSLVYGTLASDLVIGNDEVGALIPADVKVEAGASSLALSIKNVEEEVLSDALSTLDVHINGVAKDNTVPMLVKLGAVLEAGLGETELKLYHIENGTPVLMMRVNSTSDFAIHNQYVYDAETGEVTIYVATFSVFTAVQAEADVWDGESTDTSWYNVNDTEFTLTTVEQFIGFRDLVDAGTTFEGKTVILGVDIDLNGNLFDPIGFGYDHQGGKVFKGTFDGGNHTVYGLYQNGWDLDPDKENYSTYTYSTAGGGLFASIKDSTIKNLAVSGANIVFECVDIGIVVGYAQGTCHFENIVVTNSTIANYNRATGGVVGEVCFGPYGTDVSKGYSHTFINITVDSSVVVSSLWGSFDTLCGGVIGGKWGDATVKMENVTVAAELDVFSDVTAAYQWYAYRRCGMLIGHTEQNSPKKALNAAAEFLTCENVNVYYGDWVNYNYYEFANQDSGTGQRYPWVRAEEGRNNGAFSNPRYGVPTFDGVKVTEMDAAAFELAKSGYAAITFNQLYGGGQGVYGCAEHAGVTTHSKLTKTLYINNNLGWTNLKLYYWFANGNDTWSTLIDGIDMTEITDGIYKIDVPAYAEGFKITGDNENETPEILMSTLNEGETVSLAFVTGGLSIEIDGVDSFVTTNGNWLYNTSVTSSTASKYDFLIYDKHFIGSLSTNGYGVALVLDSTGKLIEIYDGANVGYYTEAGKAATAHFDANNYATVAWSELGDDETLIIVPNEGSNTPNKAREWALTLRTSVGSNPSIGKIISINADIHYCENACDTCGGCRNLQCTDAVCSANRCTCLVFHIKVDGINNTFVATKNKWLYNTQVNVNNYPYAAHYEIIVYDKSYEGTFTTNTHGVAMLLDADGNLIKAYDWTGYYTKDGKVETTDYVNTFATQAWEDLQSGEGETLVIFPNMTGSLDTDPSRKFAKDLCDAWTNTMGKEVTLTATNKLPKTIYFKNNWLWGDVRLYYWYADGTYHTEFPGIALTPFDNDGTYDYYKVTIPANVVGVIFTGNNHDVSTRREQTTDIIMANVSDGTMFVLDVHTDNELKIVSITSQNFATYRAGYKIVNLKPTSNWKKDNARFAVYAYASNTDYLWANLSDIDGDGIYSGWIPTKYTKIIFCRMIANTENNWNNKLAQTVDITSEVIDGYTYTVDGKIYLKPNTNWSSSNARFAVYFFNDTTGKNSWVSMYKDNNTEYYWCDMPIDGSWEGMIIVRMNGSNSTNDWSNKWNQTNNLSIPLEGGKTLYTISGSNWGDGSSNIGTWSTK